jgi:hypothetical protein
MLTEYKISLIIGITSITIFSLLIGSLFIEGTNGIVYGSIKRNGEPARNETERIDELIGFITEIGGFATHHHIENFLFASFFSSSIVYFPVYLGRAAVKLTVMIYLYFIIILKQLSFAAMYEFIEKFIIFFFDVILIYVPSIEPIRPYVTGGENIVNTMLSDLPQAVFASIVFILFIHFKLVVPISYRLYKKKFWVFILRFIIYAISGISTLLTFVKKKYSFLPHYMNNGFYAHCAIRIFMLNFLYLEDLIECKKNSKNFKLEKREINIFYIMIFGYLILQWISTLDLNTWGYIMSNIMAFLYFGFWIIIRKAILEK